MFMKYITAAVLLFLHAAIGPVAACPPEIEALVQRVASLRKISEGFSPPCRGLPVESLRNELDRKLRRDLPLAPEVHLEAMARLGLIEAFEPDLYKRLLAFYGSQVLGFYEPAENRMVVVQGGSAPAGAGPLVWAHELAHAAQEARFGLPSRILSLGSNADAQRAASAVAEGDATLVMFVIAGPGGARNLPEPAQFRSAQEQALAAFGEIPRLFLEELLFPYAAGYEFIHDAFQRNGWPGVDRILAAPPASTAEILHPGRTPPGTPLSDAILPQAPPGYETVLRNTLGEWGLAQWLRRVVDEEEAAELAAGWDADRYGLFRAQDNPDRWALAMRIRLRSVEERRSLETTLRRIAPELLKNLTGGGSRPRLEWTSEGNSFELRAGWPRPAAQPSPG